MYIKKIELYIVHKKNFFVENISFKRFCRARKNYATIMVNIFKIFAIYSLISKPIIFPDLIEMRKKEKIRVLHINILEKILT